MVTSEGVRVLRILRDIISEAPEDRARGADAATDLIQEYSDAETLSIAFTLVCSCEVEGDLTALEAQLHALAGFAEHNLLPRFVLLRLLALEVEGLTGSAREHLDFLVGVAGAE